MSDEVWYKVKCDVCGEVNWVYGGYFPDPDLSKLDIDSFRCWQCGHEQSLDPECFKLDECMYMVDGKKVP